MATVSPESGSITPTGAVQFVVDGAPAGAPVSLSAESATASFTSLPVGIHTIAAVYAGDSRFDGSTGTLAGGQTIDLVATTTAVTSSMSPSSLGEAVTFTVTVSPVAGSGTPTGSVQLRAAGISIGSATSLVAGVASVTTSTLSLGSYAITADYGGDGTFGPSTGTLVGGKVVSPVAVLFNTLTPCRILDTRDPDGALAGPSLEPGQDRAFAVSTVCGIPPTAKSLSVNVTVSGSAAPGYLTLHAGDVAASLTSSISLRPGLTRANNAIVPLSIYGSCSFGVLNASAGTVDVVVDVNGYFE
jgi:hypothetical protein